MRKLLTILNAMAKHETRWSEITLQTTSTLKTVAKARKQSSCARILPAALERLER
jgi:hypothetical protein